MAKVTSEVKEKILKELQRVYPKARSYTDLWQFAIGSSYTEYNNRHGGSVLRDLENAGKVKKITVGYYVAVPQ